ncbi:MAG TPA: hypothetical protein VH437_23905 [Terriglobales bacterium]
MPFRSRTLRRPLLIAASLLVASLAHSQVFRVQGGVSTMFNADGASVDIKGPNYDANMGLGFFDGQFEFGGFVRSKIAGYTVTTGDDNVPFDLPTDIFDSTHYFSARGLGISQEKKQRSFYAFGGMTSTWFGTAFFQAAHAETPVGILFFNEKLKPDLKFCSRNIVSSRQTSLQALEWQPEKWLTTSFTAGLGSNQAYVGTGATIQTEKMMLKLGYIAAGTEFRRVTVVSPLNPEVERENIELTYRPNSVISIVAGHHNLLQPIDFKSPMVEVTVNEAVANFNVSKLYFGVGAFNSRFMDRNTVGTNLYAGRRFGQRFDTSVNFFESRTDQQSKTAIVTLALRERLLQRLSLLQLISRSEGQTTAAFGGEVVTNRFHVQVDYQNVYLPLRPDHPFQQALALNAAIRIFGPLQMTAASNIAPDGRMRYAFGLATFLYRYQGMVSWGSQDTYSFPKYVIQGTVKDVQGNPIQGAALRIGNDVVYSDDTGHFLLRLRKKQECALQVAPDEFMTNDYFEVVKAPVSVWPELESEASLVDIVLRKVPYPRDQRTATSAPSVH